MTTVAGNVWRPSLQSRLRIEVVEGEAIVLDRDGQRVHHLNEVATFILGLCTGARTTGEIVAAVQERYEVDETVASAHADELLRQLRALDVVT